MRVFNIYRPLLVVALMALFPIIVPAQSLPSLSKADNISTGTLSNGISYYIVKNDSQKDYADISLVRKGGWAQEDRKNAGEGVVRARGAITELPRFTMSSPMQFLSRGGVSPLGGGYVQRTPDATVFSFRDLEVTMNPEMVDSTLLMIFDIISSDAQYSSKRYSPSRHAIVVAGDVDASSVKGKMEMLSLMVPPGNYSSTDDPGFSVADTLDRDLASPAEGLSRLTVQYRTPRLSREDLSTVLPLVQSKYASDLSVILRRRISYALHKAKIPLPYLDIEYRDGSAGPGDDVFSISVCVPSDSYQKTCEILSAILADIDKNGVRLSEYKAAQMRVESVFRTRYSSLSNEGYTRKCISSFLYGSALASPSSELDFFTGKDMSGENAVKLFSNFSKALIAQPSSSLVRFISYDASVLSQQVRKTFDSAWAAASYKVLHP